MNTEKIMQAFEGAFITAERENLYKYLEKAQKDVTKELEQNVEKLKYLIKLSSSFEEICGVIRRIDEISKCAQTLTENYYDCMYWEDVITGVYDNASK